MMKKLGIFAVTLVLTLALTACSSSDEPKEKEIEGPVAEKYHQMMDVEKSTYYLETEVSEQFMEEGIDPEPMTSVSGTAIDGKQEAYLYGADQLTDRQIVKDGLYYNLSEEAKTYFITETSPDDLNLKFDHYVKSAEVEYKGKVYRYDEYEESCAMDSFAEDESEVIQETYLYIKRYVVDSDGNLAAIVYQNKEKGEDKAFYQRVDKVTKLQEGSVPEGIFEIPSDYKKIEEGADDPMLEP